MKKPRASAFFLFIVAMIGFVIVVDVANAESKTITVPDDYPTIRAAVGNASAGDTVFVRKGTYQEFIEINRPLSLIGEDRSNTIIKGRFASYGRSPPIITVDAPNVTVSGFTITQCDGTGIDIEPAGIKCAVKNNIIIDVGDGISIYASNSYYGIGMVYSTDILISGNLIANNSGKGIYCSCANTTITNNTLAFNNATGIIIDEASNITLSFNTIKGNGQPEGDPRMRIYGGIYLRWDGPFYLHGNNITENLGYGIQFGEGCYNSSVYQNNIELNEIGIKLLNYALSENLTFGQGNSVYENNIISNSIQVLVDKKLDSWNPDFPSINGTDSVSWDNGTVGSYWGDYLTMYTDASEVDSLGVGNMPYLIDPNNVDYYPLLKPIDASLISPSPASSPSIPEFPLIAVLPISAITAVIVAAHFLRKTDRKAYNRLP